MSEDYVTAKIKESLQLSQGDKHVALKHLVTTAVRDSALLLGLTKPHLKAIIAARIDHVIRSGDKKEGSSSDTPFSQKDLESVLTGQPLGEKRSAPKVAPPKSSERQASAIRFIVDAFKKK